MPSLRIQRYLIAGVLTFIPLWVTWLVFRFAVGLLASFGAPLVAGLVATVGVVSAHAAEELNQEWLVFVLALLLTLAALYVIGLLASLMVGQRLFAFVEQQLERIPLVKPIYGGTKKLMTVLQTRPSGVQRVVLITFPRQGMQAVGFVTRVMTEEGSGRPMAAVYIPTTPNPTGGYLEIVPVDELTPTNWSMDQAMAFVISGGAVVPDSLPPTAGR